MPTPTLIITIAPERGGKHTMLVSLRGADGTQGPPRKISVDLDGRLVAFVAAMQAIAGQQIDRAEFAPIKPSTIGRAA